MWSQIYVDLNLEMKTYNILWWLPKNWPNDVRLNCLGGKESISTFLSHEENLLEENEILIEKEGFFWECIATITFWRMRAELIFFIFYYFQSFWIV